MTDLQLGLFGTLHTIVRCIITFQLLRPQPSNGVLLEAEYLQWGYGLCALKAAVIMHPLSDPMNETARNLAIADHLF